LTETLAISAIAPTSDFAQIRQIPHLFLIIPIRRLSRIDASFADACVRDWV
jgi:hypothetical protein